MCYTYKMHKFNRLITYIQCTIVLLQFNCRGFSVIYRLHFTSQVHEGSAKYQGSLSRTVPSTYAKLLHLL